MCQDCLAAALPTVWPSLCLLLRFLANNGNGRFSLDGYFVHQQSVISICRGGEIWVWIWGRYERWTAGNCALHQQSGGGRGPATVKANWLAAERLWKKCHRAEETTEERAARMQSYMPFCSRCSHQACTTVAVSSLCNCSTCLCKVRTLYIYMLYTYTVRVIKNVTITIRVNDYPIMVNG